MMESEAPPQEMMQYDLLQHWVPVELAELRCEVPPQQPGDVVFKLLTNLHKKRLDERSHTLLDGQVIGRDQAAAWVLHNIGLNLRRQDALHPADDRREPAEL